MYTRPPSKNGGFALVIALSLMAFVLLLLLSISTIVQVEQSAAAISKAKLQSEQSALLALNQALGTLQAEMGPDQRISANADILSSRGSGLNTGLQENDSKMDVTHPYLVGAWDTSGKNTVTQISERVQERWEIGDTINYKARVDGGFRRWLISDDGSTSMDTTQMDFAEEPSFKDSDDAFKALGTGTLGTTLANSDLDNKEIWAPLREITSGTSSRTNARIGWVVLDESVKARMNQSHQLASNTSPSNAEALKAWDTSGNIAIEAMSELASFKRESPDLGKISSFANASLFMDTESSIAHDTFGPYFHDLSLNSAGVMADVVNGGLKRDLSILAEKEPSTNNNGYMDRYLYSDTTIAGQTENPLSDPKWSAILDYISLYKNSDRLVANGNSLPVAQFNAADWSADWSGSVGSRPGLDFPLSAPSQFRLSPAVAQFEIYFSFLALVPEERFMTNAVNAGSMSQALKDVYSGSSTLGATGRQLHLCVSPVITLYNPYNVPLKLDPMWLVFRDIPVGMRFTRYDQVDTSKELLMTDDFVPFAAMNSKGGGDVKFANDGSQRFTMKLTAPGREGVTLAPGESVVYSPVYDSATKITDLDNWNSEENGRLEANPGYSQGVGLYWDAFIPEDLRKDETINIKNGRIGRTGLEGTLPTTGANFNLWFVFINQNDKLKVELGFADGTQNPQKYTPNGPQEASLERNGTFSLELYSESPGTENFNQDNSSATPMIGRYTFDYNEDSIKSTASDDRKEYLDKALPIDQDENVLAINEMTYTDIDTPAMTRAQATVDDVQPYTFGVFRVGGKVTDQVAGSPFQPSVASAFNNTSLLSGHHHIGEESPTFTNYNFSIVPQNGITGDLGPTIDSENRGRFFSGYDNNAGTQFGTLFELPLSPLQSIASLQHANLAASGYLPQVSHVVGNSRAHPMIGSSEALSERADSYDLFDHSYLANTRLWDSYYFSTMADQSSILDSSGDDFSTTVTNFLAGDPLPNATFKRHFPKGTDTSIATADLIDGSEAYRKAAAYQLQEGTFNINSTSVEAWKAILASTNIGNSVVRQPIYDDPDHNSNALAFNTDAGQLKAAYSRFRIPNYSKSLEDSLGSINSIGAMPSEEDLAIWQGYRELDNNIISQLANDIVDQIRYRGPFLSMADFVNRRLGSESGTDTRAQMGAIDAAIAQNTTINGPLTQTAGVDISNHLTYINSSDHDNAIKNQTAVAGNTIQGAPSYLTQADILQQIGSRLSARSDTFVIRAYGEVVHPITGDITASSLCEAVVQRIPDYVDTSLNQTPDFDSNISTLEPDGLSDTNEQFGRRFKIVQLNWLNPSDV